MLVTLTSALNDSVALRQIHRPREATPPAPVWQLEQRGVKMSVCSCASVDGRRPAALFTVTATGGGRGRIAERVVRHCGEIHVAVGNGGRVPVDRVGCRRSRRRWTSCRRRTPPAPRRRCPPRSRTPLTVPVTSPGGRRRERNRRRHDVGRPCRPGRFGRRDRPSRRRCRRRSTSVFVGWLRAPLPNAMPHRPGVAIGSPALFFRLPANTPFAGS